METLAAFIVIVASITGGAWAVAKKDYLLFKGYYFVFHYALLIFLFFAYGIMIGIEFSSDEGFVNSFNDAYPWQLIFPFTLLFTLYIVKLLAKGDED